MGEKFYLIFLEKLKKNFHKKKELKKRFPTVLGRRNLNKIGKNEVSKLAHVHFKSVETDNLLV